MVENTGPVLAPSIYQGATPNNVTAPINYGASNQGSSGGGGLSLKDMPMNFGGNSPFGGSGLSSITSKINSFGTSIGFAPGTVSYGTAFGPSMPGVAGAFGPELASAGTPIAGSSGAIGSLSGTLGAAGLGALAGGFLGKIGGNATGGSIGGGLGAGIGMAMGGPPGAIIGGLLGGIGGGFFGGKKPGTVASEFGGGLTADGSWSYMGYGAKRSSQDFAQGLSQDLGSYLSGAAKDLGVQFKPIAIRGGMNTLHSPSGQPGFLTVGDKQIGFNPDDAASKKSALTQALTMIATNSGLDPAAINEYVKRRDAGLGGTAPMIAPPQAGQPTKFSEFLKDYNASIGSPRLG